MRRLASITLALALLAAPAVMAEANPVYVPLFINLAKNKHTVSSVVSVTNDTKERIAFEKYFIGLNENGKDRTTPAVKGSVPAGATKMTPVAILTIRPSSAYRIPSLLNL